MSHSALWYLLTTFTAWLAVCCGSKVEENTFPSKFADTAAALCSFSYCDSSQPTKRNFSLFNVTADFSITHHISSIQIEGFVGLHHEQQAIYVVFSGTRTPVDWIFDVETGLVPYNRCKRCMAHGGFYLAATVSALSVGIAVGELRFKYPHYRVIVTGHSKGAALATFTALDLIGVVGQQLLLINFGSPRVGNKRFAKFASKKLRSEHYRVTHHRDAVPHFPPTALGYLHLDGEWYEYPTRELKQCHGFEDETCSAQWEIDEQQHLAEEINDHLIYLGFAMLCPSADAEAMSAAMESDRDDLPSTTLAGDDLGEELQAALRGFLGGEAATADEDLNADDADDDSNWIRLQLVLTIFGVMLLLLYCCIAKRYSNSEGYIPIASAAERSTTSATMFLLNPKLWIEAVTAATNRVTNEAPHAAVQQDGVEIQTVTAVPEMGESVILYQQNR